MLRGSIMLVLRVVVWRLATPANAHCIRYSGHRNATVFNSGAMPCPRSGVSRTFARGVSQPSRALSGFPACAAHVRLRPLLLVPRVSVISIRAVTRFPRISCTASPNFCAIHFGSGMRSLVGELEALVTRWQSMVETANTAEDTTFLELSAGARLLFVVILRFVCTCASCVCVSHVCVIIHFTLFCCYPFRGEREGDGGGEGHRDV